MWTKVGILVAVNLLFFGRTLAYGLIIDDIAAFNVRGEFRTKNYWKNLWLQFRQVYIESPDLAHLFNIIMHMVNTILIYFVFKQTDLAFLTALLFCINPVCNMGSTWLSGRTYSMATTCILVGFACPILFPIMYPITFAWSISTFFAPLLMIFGEYKMLVLLLPLVAYLGRRRYLGTMKLRYNTVTPVMKKIEFKKLILVSKTFAYYFFLCLFPWKLGMCHSYLHTFGLSAKETEPWFKLDKFFWTGILLFGGIGYTIYNLGFDKSFGLIWFCVFAIQWCNWVVINHPITERYMYLANIGLMYFLAQFIINTPVMWAVLTLYAVLNLKFTPVYTNCLEYWKSNIETFPNVAMGYNQYGLELRKRGKTGTAFDIWLTGLTIRPKDFRISYNISNLLAEQGRWDIITKFLVTAEKALDKNNNYKFWRKKVTELKNIAKANGVRFNVPKKVLEAERKQRETDEFVRQQEINDVKALQSKPFMNMKYKPDYIAFLQNKYKFKLEGVPNGTDVQRPTGRSEAKSDTGAGGITV